MNISDNPLNKLSSNKAVPEIAQNRTLEFMGCLYHRDMIVEAKMNIEELEYSFRNAGVVIKALLNTLRDYDSDLLTIDFITSKLRDYNIPENQIRNVTGFLDKLRVEDNPTIQLRTELRTLLISRCHAAKHNRLMEKFPNDPERVVSELRNYHYKDLGSSTFQVEDLGSLDATQLSELYFNNPIQSSIPMINKAFAGKEGYLRGSLIAVCGAPKRGKSLLLMQEATHFVMNQNLNVHYLALGDLNKFDFLVRMCAQVNKVSFDVAYADTRTQKDRMMKQLYKGIPSDQVLSYDDNGITKRNRGRLDITCKGAGELSPIEYSNLSKQLLLDYDVLIIDYDYNFKKDSDDMYSRGGELYNILNSIKTNNNQLILVATQPSKPYWSSPLLDDQCLGESSMKQMIIDGLITIGQYPESGSKIGHINVALNRRGITNDCYYLRSNSGKFIEINTAAAAEYIGDPTRREHTEDDIFRYIVRTGEDNPYENKTICMQS